ncbi:hypothetical protein JXA12_01055 [Candidatus Woesearchaeota archaeon]|nr:hypothetical protein [Candidatus Woesearchaeota archaeon]
MALPGEESFENQHPPIIRYKGMFDWQGLYRLVRMWLEENKYRYHEKRYKHKGDEVEVEMVAERKIDEMHKYHIFIYFHIWDLRDIEVVEGTKTLQRNTGRLHIKMEISVEIDYSKRFDESKPITKKLKEWWIQVRRQEINALHHDKITREIFSLHNDIKTFLNMRTDANYYT